MAAQAQLIFKRNEVKYLLTREQRSALERVMAQHNRMVGDEWGPSTICNVYYDTPTLLLARRSAEKPAYKEKLRTRSYGVAEPGQAIFVELKKKYAGVVYKRRASLPEVSARALLAGECLPTSQIERELAYTAQRYEGLAPRAFVAYDRVAYFSPEDHEFRMTFDMNLRARWEELDLCTSDAGAQVMDDDLSILEVKCLGGMPLWLVRHLSEAKLFKTSCSKYGSVCKQLLDCAA